MAGTETLARGLGWFSIALGLTEVFATEPFTETLGLRGKESLVRAFGAREIAAGIGILATSGTSPGWVWARVAGDALDLAVLASAYTPDNPKRDNVCTALVAVAGVAVLDIICAEQLSQRAGVTANSVAAVGAPKGSGAHELTYTVIINRPAVELQDLWRDAGIQAYIKSHYLHAEAMGDMQNVLRWKFTASTGQTFRWSEHVIAERAGEYTYFQSLPGADIPNEGSLHFRPAPNAGRTEVTLRFRFTPPGGVIGQAALRLASALPETFARDVLHRFKVVAETGEMPPLQQEV